MSTETLTRILCSALSVGDDGKLPTEFRLFKRGVNETTKGPFLFDDEAARLVMARWQREGVDMIADLEHLSLDPDSPNYDPDARAHFQLSVRDGELWACNARWCGDGPERLRRKTQRYISPVAERDTKTNRVMGVLNVALVAQPATFGAMPLVAASRSLARRKRACNPLSAAPAKAAPKEKLSKMFPPELVKKITDALASGDQAAQAAMLPEILAAMVTGGSAEEAAEGDAGADPLAETAEPLPEEDPMKPSALAKALGFKSDAEAAAHIKALSKQVTAQNEATAAVELETRCGLVAELVTLGVEFPSTAWRKNADGSPNGKAPVDRLMVEPLADLRQRVALHKAKGFSRKPVEAPATSAGGETPAIAPPPPHVVALAKKKGISLEELAERRKNAVRRI